jgi:hypothetical protein
VLPAIIVAAYGASAALTGLAKLLRLRAPATAATLALVIGAAACLAGGALQCTRQHDVAAGIRDANHAAIAWGRQQGATITLWDPWCVAVVGARAPELFRSEYGLGTPGVSDPAALPAAVRLELASAGPDGAPAVLVVLRAPDLAGLFPAWNAVLGRHYALAASRVGPHVWVGLYRRTTELQAEVRRSTAHAEAPQSIGGRR